jgi:DNA-binding NarL/FixJ family response regulator
MLSRHHLAPRQRQVVDLVMQGKTNKQIAAEMGLTTGTVKVYLVHIFNKCGVGNRTELALWAVREAANAAAA